MQTKPGLWRSWLGICLPSPQFPNALLLRVLLAAATAACLAAIDVTYALTGRISAIYLLDAGVEVVLLLAIIVGWLRMRSRHAEDRHA